MKSFLNEKSRNNIDLDYVLKGLEVITPYGRDLKNELKPFRRGEEPLLNKELDRVSALIEKIHRDKGSLTRIKDILSHIKDIGTSIKRAVEGYSLTEVELFEIKVFILYIRELYSEIEIIREGTLGDIKIERIKELETLLDPQNTGNKTFYIYEEYSEELKGIRQEKKEIARQIQLSKKNLRGNIESEIGVRFNLEGFITVSKDDKERIDKIEKNPNLAYSSETYLNIKYSLKSSDLMDNLEKQEIELKEREDIEELRIRGVLSKSIGNYGVEIEKNIKAIGRLDLTIAKAYMAIAMEAIRPVITNSSTIKIIDGRHPRVEEDLKKKGKTFTPITVDLSNGVTCITGANMGGKTVSLRLVALICAMAQYGFFVPAKEMELGLLDFIEVSIGDLQSLDQGLSTFGGEIRSIQEAIVRSEKRGLILIDELARGTNPQEGYAISKAIVEYLKGKPSFTVITTHYDNLANHQGIAHLQVVGLSRIDFTELREEMLKTNKEGMEIIGKYMDYRLMTVNNISQVPRDAINIAELMGLENSILKEAEKILRDKRM